MAPYLTTKTIAADCKVDAETVTRTAARLKIGTPGPHPNSPHSFQPAEALAIAKAIFAEREGIARNRLMEAQAETLNVAERIGNLAGLATAMQHPAAREIQTLAGIVGAIRNSTGGKADLKTTGGKTKFLNSFRAHETDLFTALNAVTAKL